MDPVPGDVETNLGAADAATGNGSANGGGEVAATGSPPVTGVQEPTLRAANGERGVRAVDAGTVVDLRFGDLAIDLHRDSDRASVLQDVLPMGEVASVIERHVGGTRLAALVTKRSLRRSGVARRLYGLGKRTLDVGAASVLVILLLPLWVVVATAILLSSRGPVFYRQRRYGKGGRAFTILKFRTMVQGADAMIDEMEDLVARGEVEALDEVVFKAHDDPRITSIGRLLRRTNLDETPQLLNVIFGSMSLVGPRPLVAAEVEELSDQLLDIRHSVPPGITCLWQVMRREDTTFAERMALDVLYVRRRSMLLDSLLLGLTPSSILRGVRSY